MGDESRRKIIKDYVQCIHQMAPYCLINQLRLCLFFFLSDILSPPFQGYDTSPPGSLPNPHPPRS